MVHGQKVEYSPQQIYSCLEKHMVILEKADLFNSIKYLIQ